MIANKQTTHT